MKREDEQPDPKAWKHFEPLDREGVPMSKRISPNDGGCWYCEQPNGEWFSTEFDCFLHEKCLRERLISHPQDPEAKIMERELLSLKLDPADLCGDCLTATCTLHHCYPGDDDMTDVYVEQSEKGKDICEVSFTHSLASYYLTFLDSRELDKLSQFFAEAAQQLRMCSQ